MYKANCICNRNLFSDELPVAKKTDTELYLRRYPLTSYDVQFTRIRSLDVSRKWLDDALVCKFRLLFVDLIHLATWDTKRRFSCKGVAETKSVIRSVSAHVTISFRSRCSG